MAQSEDEKTLCVSIVTFSWRKKEKYVAEVQSLLICVNNT